MGSEADLSFELSGLQLAGPDMLVDEYEQYNNDRPDVVEFSPEGASEGPAEVEAMADDCTCSASFPPYSLAAYHALDEPPFYGVMSEILPSHPAHARLLKIDPSCIVALYDG